MMAVFVDSDVLLDIMTEDPQWADWSKAALAQAADEARLVINPVVYTEVSVRFLRIEDLEKALPKQMLEREPLPYAAAFLAAKVFLAYRQRGGMRTSPLPDFFIGAHKKTAHVTWD